jgi:hypothetical protein
MPGLQVVIVYDKNNQELNTIAHHIINLGKYKTKAFDIWTLKMKISCRRLCVMR